jgi:hypothetical protein
LLPNHIVIEQSDNLTKYSYKVDMLYSILLLLILFALIYIRERNYKTFVPKFFLIMFLLIFVFMANREQSLTISNQYFICNEKQIFFADIRTATFGRVEKPGRFSSGTSVSLDLATTQGELNLQLSEICQAKVAVITQEFLDREIPVYNE